MLPKLGVGLLLLAGSLGMAALSFPSLSPLPSRSPLLAVNNWDDGVRRGFLAFSLLFSAAFLLWACAFAALMVLAAVELRRMNYLQTRYLQLSYRFFFLQVRGRQQDHRREGDQGRQGRELTSRPLVLSVWSWCW